MWAFLLSNWQLCLGAIFAIAAPLSTWLYGRKKFNEGYNKALAENLKTRVQSLKAVDEIHSKNEALTPTERLDKFKQL